MIIIKQKEIIGRNKPYNRFWKISKTDSIGAKTYGSLFKHYYNLVIDCRSDNGCFDCCRETDS